MVVDMGVEVDESRSDHLAGEFDPNARPGNVDVGNDGGDAIAVDPHVENRVDPRPPLSTRS